MSKIGLVIILMLMAGSNYAQQNYFVLIQADNNQPFYARIEDKSFSSSPQGHLILSQLKEGTYTLVVGFPKKLFPEQQFSISLNKKDLEFQLKDLGEKGWGLFNPQTLELKTGEEKKEDQPLHHLEGVKKDDAFSRLMAGVVSDTAVMYNNYAMEATLRDSPAVAKVAMADTASSALQGMSRGVTASRDSAGISGISPDTTGAVESRSTTSPPASLSAGSGAAVIPNSVLPSAGTSPDSGVAAKDTSALVINGSAGIPRGVSSDSAVTSSGISATDTSARAASSGATSSEMKSSGTISSGAPAIVPLPAGGTSLNKAGSVVKLSERKTTKGLRLAFADRQKGRKTDTIIVIIPVDTIARMAQGATEVSSSVSAPARSDTPATSGTDRPATPLGGTDRPVAPSGGTDRSAALSNGSEGTATKIASPATPLFRPDTLQKKSTNRLPFINSDCKNFATDYDVDKLRVKMLESAKEEDRILVARKIFKTKCFTTRQIRALSEVFISEGQKFKFFETAYPFVSDEHFRELSDLLADPVYNSKFKTMTGQ